VVVVGDNANDGVAAFAFVVTCIDAATIVAFVDALGASDVTADSSSNVATFNLAFLWFLFSIAKIFGCFNAAAKSSSSDASLGSYRVMRKYLFGARAMLSLFSRTRLESRLASPLNTDLPRPSMIFFYL
jgi:hypothetical protein